MAANVRQAIQLGNVKEITDMVLAQMSAATSSGDSISDLHASFSNLLQSAQSKWSEMQARQRSLLDHAARIKWATTVRELGNRAVSLRKLLEFYEALPSQMPRYDPDTSLTKDVVRGAIIPMSREKQSDLASILMEGKPTPAMRMVTHNWGNKFAHLIAAVVSDALGKGHYAGILERLKGENIRELKRELEENNALDITYWICAFCVNQHMAICGIEAEPPKGTKQHESWQSTKKFVEELSLREGWQMCNCGMKKIFNTEQPTLHDGQSVACELNKFDAMMGHLAATRPDFSQVVAVDDEFELFDRAWCVAELAEGNKCKLDQRLKVHSAQKLKQFEAKMRKSKGLTGEDTEVIFDVAQMKASRQEDVDLILSKIRKFSDVPTFNADLQDLVFNSEFGLFAQWKEQDGLGQMSAIAQCAAHAT
eukprot:gnl/TRDRNA2_/TRDRNA2_145629_c0_seq5.p1 gnl/TRDRNA2_/TRDRNA2_145629_c0~~gnl/TRDRNA2_/TRDRNA2_145629_c0_seq5.p1  ORF type:complete len:491 (+),score=97.19 gnl/TRDRNA2_/TRDRNA2_145629_c0_seq5:205-1473(+)